MDTGTIIGIAGVLIGLIGIVVAVYEGRKYRGPRLAYQYDGFNLIRSYDAVFPKSIEVTFGGERVPNLTHSQVVIWNHGRGPLTKADISATDPLLLGLGEEHKILQADIVKRTNEPNSATLTYVPTDPHARFDFEFLDAQDGVLISVWHTSPRAAPKITGTIINKNAGPFDMGRFVGPKPNVPKLKDSKPLVLRLVRMQNILARKPVVLALVMMVFGGLAVILGTAIWLSRYFEIRAFAGASITLNDDNSTGSTLGLGLPGLLYFLTGLWMWKQVRRRFPKKLLPDEYQAPDDN